MTARPDAGFGLLEVIVCVALLIAGGVLALALLPSIARASQTGLMRSAATDIARNALERMRAASAYLPPPFALDPMQRSAALADHRWVLAPAASYAGAIRVRRALCNGAQPATDIAVTVTTQYDAANDTVSAAVDYPPNPCAGATRATVTLTAQLTPAAYAPQTVVSAGIADPARQ